MIDSPLKCFSMFSGIGGFEVGIFNALSSEGIQQRGSDSRLPDVKRPQFSPEPFCVGHSEIDKYASAIYKYHYGGTNYGDATTIDARELPDFDLLCGGFPCQAFSIVGKRRGFDDIRGILFFEIARVAREKQPRYLLLENVKGLLSHDGGRTFKTIIATLAELGYGVEWQVLDSKNFGVPQNRERVFIVGHLGGFRGRQIFPVKGVGEENIAPGKVARLINNESRGHDNEPKIINPKMKNFTPQDNSVALTASCYKEPPVVLKRFIIDSNQTGGISDNGRIRRLTPIECERLQGFSDNYTKYGLFDGEVKEISDTQRYKCLGNAVTTDVIKHLAMSLFFLGGDVDGL
jgi:DNA (cytosine-5)-methyltransferase 1